MNLVEHSYQLIVLQIQLELLEVKSFDYSLKSTNVTKMYGTENEEHNEKHFKKFGFKILIAPPQNEHWNAFENDIYDLIKIIVIADCSTIHLNKDIEDIQTSKNLFVFSDKSTSL